MPTDRTACILLVEDHADSAMIAARLLRGQGYEVIIAGNVRMALEEAAANKIDLALCDIGLPDGTGEELMRELAAKYAMPGIALTGFSMNDQLAQDAETSFAAKLVKPIDFSELCRVVKDVLTQSDTGK